MGRWRLSSIVVVVVVVLGIVVVVCSYRRCRRPRRAVHVAHSIAHVEIAHYPTRVSVLYGFRDCRSVELCGAIFYPFSQPRCIVGPVLKVCGVFCVSAAVWSVRQSCICGVLYPIVCLCYGFVHIPTVYDHAGIFHRFRLIILWRCVLWSFLYGLAAAFAHIFIERNDIGVVCVLCLFIKVHNYERRRGARLVNDCVI